jgi:hypothetical protein
MIRQRVVYEPAGLPAIFSLRPEAESLFGGLSLEPDSSIPAIRLSLRKSNDARLSTRIQARTLESATSKGHVSLDSLR